MKNRKGQNFSMLNIRSVHFVIVSLSVLIKLHVAAFLLCQLSIDLLPWRSIMNILRGVGEVISRGSVASYLSNKSECLLNIFNLNVTWLWAKYTFPNIQISIWIQEVLQAFIVKRIITTVWEPWRAQHKSCTIQCWQLKKFLIMPCFSSGLFPRQMFSLL